VSAVIFEKAKRGISPWSFSGGPPDAEQDFSLPSLDNHFEKGLQFVGKLNVSRNVFH
jgi:hypothetical protein